MIAYKNYCHVIVTVGEFMARHSRLNDTATLQMALVGYQIEKQRIEDKIRAINAQLKGKRVPLSSNSASAPAPVRRVLSPAARKRIAMAQRKRWAAHRKRVAQAAKQES
jgi:hypothetical protein